MNIVPVRGAEPYASQELPLHCELGPVRCDVRKPGKSVFRLLTEYANEQQYLNWGWTPLDTLAGPAASR